MSERGVQQAPSSGTQAPAQAVSVLQPRARDARGGIADTSGQDVPLPPKSSRRLWASVAAGVAIAVVGAAALAPRAIRWSLAEVSVPRERLRLADVRYGDLVRDVSVQGRVVAAVSPTLFASAAGTITVLVDSGANVAVGSELARIDSPELTNRLQQEQALLEEQRVELDRQRIATRQRELESQKNVDLAQIALIAASRERRRVELAFETRSIAEIDVDKVIDDLHNAELGHEHALADMKLDRERLAFELRTRELQLERQDLLVRDLQRQVDELTIRSPVIGIVGNLQVDQKAAVSRDQPVMTVVDLTAFEVEADVPESYADDLGLQMPAEIRIGNAAHDAVVVAVSPEIVENQVTTRLRFRGHAAGRAAPESAPHDPDPARRKTERAHRRARAIPRFGRRSRRVRARRRHCAAHTDRGRRAQPERRRDRERLERRRRDRELEHRSIRRRGRRASHRLSSNGDFRC